jgi:hypothetical protein
VKRPDNTIQVEKKKSSLQKKQLEGHKDNHIIGKNKEKDDVKWEKKDDGKRCVLTKLVLT